MPPSGLPTAEHTHAQQRPEKRVPREAASGCLRPPCPCRRGPHSGGPETASPRGSVIAPSCLILFSRELGLNFFYRRETVPCLRSALPGKVDHFRKITSSIARPQKVSKSPVQCTSIHAHRRLGLHSDCLGRRGSLSTHLPSYFVMNHSPPGSPRYYAEAIILILYYVYRDMIVSIILIS